MSFDCTPSPPPPHTLSLSTRISTHPHSRACAEIRRLLQYDQLIGEHRDGNLFAEFDEMEITFPPTYKYVPGSDNVYDRGQFSGKSRLPAWCDRVMFSARSRRYAQHTAERRASAGRGKDHSTMACDALVPVLYHAETSGAYISDHRPVLAMFDLFPAASALELKLIAEEKERRKMLLVAAEQSGTTARESRSRNKMMAMLGEQ